MTPSVSLHLGEIIFGTFFLAFGLMAAGIAVIRRGRGISILIWLAMWSGAYGASLMLNSEAIRMLLPHWFLPVIPYLNVLISYMILVFALLTWRNLTKSGLRIFLRIMIIGALIIGMAGIGWFIVYGQASTFVIFNNLLAASILTVLIIVLSFRRLSQTYLVLPNRGVLAAGTLLFAGEALYSNLFRLFGFRTWAITGWLGFAALLSALAYVAAKMIFANERRLIAIENELETARRIQSSILPDKVPQMKKIEIAVAYYPMNAVAGDFYEFIQIDEHRAGFLVADVSGHGIPAALIASMIKVAVQTAVAAANDPGEVLRLLGRTLGNQLREGQFLTAAYLYIDSESGEARYSAAGHPPLLHWNSAMQQVRFIESNGLIIGFFGATEYPVQKFSFNKGDRFLLYTDGLTEAENPEGEFFGDHRLGRIIRSRARIPTNELSGHILKELQIWQHSQQAQQDDITWIIVDVC